MSYYPTTYGNIAITGSSNQYIVSSGSNTARTSSIAIQGKTLQLDAGADIKFGGTSLMETLREIQSQLAILTPDSKLEEEFEELRACAQEYERLRTKFLEQKRVWDALKQQTF
jgi:hypothetical protein